MAVTVEARKGHAPMTALTRPVPQGSTWIDCEARGLQHDYVGSKTTDVAVYLRCSRCPVIRRTSRRGVA